MKKERIRELMMFIYIAVPSILAFLVTAYLIELGHEWFAERFMLTFFVGMMWCMLMVGIRTGCLRPYWKSEHPRAFAFMKYWSITVDSLLSIGVAWLWFH